MAHQVSSSVDFPGHGHWVIPPQWTLGQVNHSLCPDTGHIQGPWKCKYTKLPPVFLKSEKQRSLFPGCNHLPSCRVTSTILSFILWALITGWASLVIPDGKESARTWGETQVQSLGYSTHSVALILRQVSMIPQSQKLDMTDWWHFTLLQVISFILIMLDD